MKRIIYIFKVALLGILAGCADDNDDDTVVMPPAEVAAPVPALLIFPEDNTECNEGTILSDEESAVTFRWGASENTDSYQVTLKNLENENFRFFTADTNVFEITLRRGNPYSWFVTSRSDASNEAAVSEEFRFYNAGSPTGNFAPFPADAISPAKNATVSLGSVTLEWMATDIDDDIISHEVFLGTENPPNESIALTEADDMDTEVEIESPGIYFWSVVTLDEEGNSATSQIFRFTVE